MSGNSRRRKRGVTLAFAEREDWLRCPERDRLRAQRDMLLAELRMFVNEEPPCSFPPTCQCWSCRFQRAIAACEVKP